jgi:type II secretory ATPase GspE/PulE/Tfp pilus assembly ATPase PilB-like protein
VSVSSTADTAKALADAQKLLPSERGLSFEVLFFRQLQQVTTRIHDADNLDQLMLDVSQDICRLLNADRLTLYAVSEDKTAIVSRLKTGLNTSKELKLPLTPQSIAGYVGLTRQMLNIEDVYNQTALHAIDPRLTFLQQVDQRSGYRTREMLVAPVVDGSQLLGVLQVINNKSAVPFGALETDGVRQLCTTLATAMRRRMGAAERDHPVVRASRFDGLVKDGLITSDELQACMFQAREQGLTVEHLLMANLHLKPAQIGPALSRFFDAAYIPFAAGRIRNEILHGRLKREFVLAHQWLALEDGPDGLLVMTLDPEAVRSARLVPQVFPQFSRFVYGVTTQVEFEETVAQLYGAGDDGGSIDELLADMQAPQDEDAGDDQALANAAADNELVKFVNKVVVDAYHQGASDIHIEPQPGKAKTGIRFRVDGSLVPYIEVPAHFRQAMVTRIKIMCDLDISEKRKPQDGKIKFRKYGPLDIELRVATLPSAGGVEDVVMRILAAGEPIPLDKLGLTSHNKERLLSTVSKPYGLFYVCGPTGSGKTTTLHSILKHLNTSDTKIWTAEDPVEITQKGLRQVQINKKAGIDFAMVMRAFLRADPDIIMVGESRDKETVSMGVEASLTGHLVFSTLHTNSAPESITRLLDMGMDPFNFADALLGVLAQRLAKRLCECKEVYTPDAKELQRFVQEYAQELAHTSEWQNNPSDAAQNLVTQWSQQHGSDGALRFYRAKGCEKCRGSGYKGRVGLHELLVADEITRKLIQERARVADLFAACVSGGMRTLKMDGMEKVLMGLTDLKQVRAVCAR